MIAIGAERGVLGLHTRQFDFTGGGLDGGFRGRGRGGIFFRHGGRGRLPGDLPLQRRNRGAQFFHARMFLRETRERLRQFLLHRAHGQQLRAGRRLVRQHRRAGHRGHHGRRDVTQTRAQFQQAALCGGDLALAFLAALRNPFIRTARHMRREILGQHPRRGGVVCGDRRSQEGLARLDDDLAAGLKILGGNSRRQFALQPGQRLARRDRSGKIRRLGLGAEAAFKREQANRSGVRACEKSVTQTGERAEQREDNETQGPRPAWRAPRADGRRRARALVARRRDGPVNFRFLPGPHDGAI